MSDDQDLSRAELIEARDKIQRELEVLFSPSSIGGGPPSRDVVEELQAELAEIERRLANH